MQVFSIIAIYLLFWVIIAFATLPFGVKTADELGIEKVPGQADSAPANFRPWRVVISATIVSTFLTALFVLNFIYGWLKISDIDFYNAPPEQSGE